MNKYHIILIEGTFCILGNKFKEVIIQNKKYDVLMADTPLKRLVGLLKYNSIPDNQAMFITPCNSIHTVGMRFSISVIFIDKDYKVTKFVPNMLPFRLSVPLNNSWSVIEIPYKGNENLNLKKDDIIEFIE